MKRILTALATATVAALAMAEGISSSNVVGYNGIQITGANFSMLSSPFVLVGGGTDVPIASLFSDNSVFTASDTADTADYIMVWENGGYRGNTYFFSSDAENKWASDADSFSETADTIPCGTAFWLYRQSAATTATVAGQVLTANVTKNIVGKNFTMVANPFPAAMAIKDIAGADLVASDTADTADYIMVWENGGYRGNTYFFSSDAENKWASDADSFSETTDTIAVGGGFWFYRQNAGASTITLPCPYTI